MKAFTSIAQSRKLAEILPIDSADMSYARTAIAGDNLGMPEDKQYRHLSMPFRLYSGVGIPCWSLASLLEAINNDYYTTLYHDGVAWVIKVIYHDNVEDRHNVWANTPVDACVRMILKLHELNLL